MSDLVPIRVVVIDDDERFHALVESLFDLDDRFELVGAATNAAAGLGAVRWLRPDAVVVDLELAGDAGFRVIGEIRDHARPIRVVALSELPDPITLLDLLAHGVDSYLDKAAASSELMPTLIDLFHRSLQAH